MSNIPHQHTTPEEEIKYGKLTLAIWSAILLFCLFALVTNLEYWVMFPAPMIACVFEIILGKNMIKNGKKKLETRENPSSQNKF